MGAIVGVGALISSASLSWSNGTPMSEIDRQMRL